MNATDRCTRCKGQGHFDDPKKGYTKCPDCHGTGRRRWFTNMRDDAEMREFRTRCTLRNVIGPPKATEKYTVAALEHMGVVGLYTIGDSAKAQGSPSP